MLCSRLKKSRNRRVSPRTCSPDSTLDARWSWNPSFWRAARALLLLSVTGLDHSNNAPQLAPSAGFTVVPLLMWSCAGAAHVASGKMSASGFDLSISDGDVGSFGMGVYSLRIPLYAPAALILPRRLLVAYSVLSLVDQQRATCQRRNEGE